MPTMFTTRWDFRVPGATPAARQEHVRLLCERVMPALAD